MTVSRRSRLSTAQTVAPKSAQAPSPDHILWWVIWWGVHMLIKQSAQQAWQRFWWHPITGPAVPMAALIGLVTWCWYAVGLPIGLGARANMTDFDCRDFATQ